MTARRRMFGTLLAVTGVSVMIAATGLATWWVALPPIGMLAGFVMLLREAARTDAERGNARAAATPSARRPQEPHAEGLPGRVTSDTAASAGGEPGGRAAAAAAADVYDITERVGEEIYDQYADAKLRAVGD